MAVNIDDQRLAVATHDGVVALMGAAVKTACHGHPRQSGFGPLRLAAARRSGNAFLRIEPIGKTDCFFQHQLVNLNCSRPSQGNDVRFDGLDLNLLVVFDALIEESSVSGAARRLNMSQSAMSGSLARLRQFFGDDLLVQVGNKMMPTETGLELAGRVREVLTLVRATITTPIEFNPATVERQFHIVVSDYVYDVMLAEVLRNIRKVAPRLTFDLATPTAQHAECFQRGEVDLFITIEDYLFADHPARFLFEDRLSVIAWNGAPARNGTLTMQEFLERPCVDIRFGPGRAPSFVQRLIRGTDLKVNVEVRVDNFNSVLASVIETDRLALLNGLHALHFSRLYPLAVYPLPMPAPLIREHVQWHSKRRSDAGVQWLKDRIVEGAHRHIAAGT
ncbi:hypothetical protein A6A40_22450 (plasmid) [Azospirillum humicireducens]|uniref:HTH lysR-type domain-containing protein n=1 Tax=Azospirillum humicireducens TaxID=1226968 RepID=A0A2R4VTT0_9PROT|nr:hypothetical protein A6A40_22450 [Azospirillum humicireducens]